MDPSIYSIAPEELDAYLDEHKDDIYLIDVRMPYEYAQGHLEESINLPYQALIINSNKVPKDKLIVCYCLHGVRSLKAAKLLSSRGYTKLAHLAGGITEYKALK